LIGYEGTVVMVSHDRDFMKGICDRLFEFRDGQVKEHLCDIEEFMQKRKVERLNELDLDKTGRVAEPEAVVAKPIITKPAVDENALKQVRNQLKKTEEQIESLEKEIKACNEQLSDPKKYEQLMNDKTFFDRYNKLKVQLDEAMLKWEDLSAKLA